MSKPTDYSGSFSALARLIRYARGYRRRVIYATVCSVINKLFDIAPEILIGIAIDVVVNQEESFVARLGFDSAGQQIVALAVLTFFIWVGESVFEYLYRILWRNLAQHLQADIRQDAYDRVQAQDMAWFEARSSGELVAIMNDDVNQLERFLDGGANDLVQVLVTVVAIGGVFIVLSPLIALFAFTPIPLIVWGAFFFQRRAAPLYNDVRARVGDLANRLHTNLGGMATIKSFTAEARESARLRATSDDYVRANRRAIAISSAFIPVIRMAILVGFLATFLIGGFQVLQGNLNVGAYGVLVFLTQRLLWPLTSLAETVDLFERAMASTRRILDLVQMPIQSPVTGTRTLPAPVRGDLGLNNLSYRYPANGQGVQDINARVPAGGTLAVVGATGAGKSTLVKLLLGFQKPDAGEITIDGIPASELTLNSRRSAIGWVSQEVFLFEGSIGDNIAYGVPDASEAAILEAAEQAEAREFIERLPEGMNTRVGERGVRLSGGQRQRLALARALLKDPPLLVLDEATSAVDNETEAAIQRSLNHIASHRTVVLIAHRLSTVVGADEILVLSQGKVVERGTHQELIRAGGEYARQWAVQTGNSMANG